MGSYILMAKFLMYLLAKHLAVFPYAGKMC